MLGLPAQQSDSGQPSQGIKFALFLNSLPVLHVILSALYFVSHESEFACLKSAFKSVHTYRLRKASRIANVRTD